jgi:hypothetical protein
VTEEELAAPPAEEAPAEEAAQPSA